MYEKQDISLIKQISTEQTKKKKKERKKKRKRYNNVCNIAIFLFIALVDKG